MFENARLLGGKEPSCLNVSEIYFQREGGRVPRTVECEVKEDLVDVCVPGDLITVTGIVKVWQFIPFQERQGNYICSSWMHIIHVMHFMCVHTYIWCGLVLARNVHSVMGDVPGDNLCDSATGGATLPRGRK